MAKGDKKKLKIDFGDVDPDTSRKQRRVKIPEGDYIAKIQSSKTEKSERTDSKYIRWTFQIVKGPHKGKTLSGMTSLKPDALWNLRNLVFAATGKNVAGKVVSFDPEALYGKVVGIAVEDNEYEGSDGKKRITSQVNTAFPKDEANETEEEESDDDEEETEEEEDEDDEDLDEVEVEDI